VLSRERREEGALVENVREELILMIRLQRIYDQISEAITEQRTAPEDVLQLAEENRQRQLELEELQEGMEALQAELREVSRTQEESRVELEHFQKQKGMVTNEREFTAVINEIDFASQALERAAARRKEIEERIEELGQDIEERRNARSEEEDAHRDVTERWDRRRSELKKRIHELAAQAKRIEERLQPSSRSRFLRLLKSKHGTALAPAIEGSCSLCHFALRPHLQQRVRRAEEIIACEHCYRILYMPELEEEAGGEENGG